VATLFIADLHLQTEEPAITAGFLRFLTGTARQADALYILGDLFEAWIGDDDPTPASVRSPPPSRRWSTVAFPATSSMAIAISCSATLCARKRHAALPEEKVLDLYGRKVLIMHGDTLCTDDAGYQAFRAKVHKPWLQRLFLALPLFVRQRIAAKMRAKQSRQQQQIAGHYGREPAGSGCRDGKTSGSVPDSRSHHRPDVHELIANGKPAMRVVLGAWHTQGSMVKVTADVELIPFPFG
jgi:UDP-2,3-diacylglucosamine hydrolase